jgi:hypothetical protein
VEASNKREDRATATLEYICAREFPTLIAGEAVQKVGAVMWLMSNTEAVIFIALVVVMVALTVFLT